MFFHRTSLVAASDVMNIHCLRTTYILKIHILTPSITKFFLKEKMKETQTKFFLMKSIHRTSKVFRNQIESFLSEKEISETINVIHVNIKFLSKYFDNLLDFLRDSNNSFNILCITETWCTDSNIKNNANLHLPKFDIISQERKTNKSGGGVIIYIHKA